MDNFYWERWVLALGVLLAILALCCVFVFHTSEPAPSSCCHQTCAPNLMLKTLVVSDRSCLGSPSASITVDATQNVVTIRGPKESVTLNLDELARLLKLLRSKRSGVLIQENEP